MVGSNADPRILHADERALFAITLAKASLDVNLSAFRRVVDGVADDIGDHLVEAHWVGIDLKRHVAEMRSEFDVFDFGVRLLHINDLLDDGLKHEVAAVE